MNYIDDARRVALVRHRGKCIRKLETGIRILPAEMQSCSQAQNSEHYSRRLPVHCKLNKVGGLLELELM